MCAAFRPLSVTEEKLTNANIVCLVRFGSGRNKLVQLLIQSGNIGNQTIRSLICYFDCGIETYLFADMRLLADLGTTAPLLLPSRHTSDMFPDLIILQEVLSDALCV